VALGHVRIDVNHPDVLDESGHDPLHLTPT
jgi:hypothetical protein